MVIELLKDPESDIRNSAALALERMAAAAAPHAAAIGELLKNSDRDIRYVAVFVLGRLRSAGASQAPALAAFLDDEDRDLRCSAAFALGEMGAAAGSQAPALVKLSRDPDSYIRDFAETALRKIDESATSQAQPPKDQDSGVRTSDEAVLNRLDDVTPSQVPALDVPVKDEEGTVRDSSVEEQKQPSEEMASQASSLGELLKDLERDIRGSAASATGIAVVVANKLQRAEPSFVLALLHQIQQNDISQTSAICAGHLVCAGPAQSHIHGRIVLFRLGNRKKPWKLPKARFDGGQPVMPALLHVWKDATQLAAEYDPVRNELVNVMQKLSLSPEWQPTVPDISELNELYTALKEVDTELNQKKSGDGSIRQLDVSSQLAAVLLQIEDLERQNPWLKWRDRVWKATAIHGVCWMILIFAYPRLAWVQAIFFWNPWVRRILGVGYVGVALAWVPFLRQRLFAPFGRSLLADADLEGAQGESYFPRSNVRQLTGMPAGTMLTVKDAIPALKGQIVLQGASGLGKTKFLQHMLARTSRIAVFLRADRCMQGVMSAIQAKLKGSASDEKYLAKLIHAGAIDICIDGLNEVSSETRAKIIHFTEDQFSGNIILTTQPIEWTPPATATVFELQPLDADQIEDFLKTRPIPEDADVTPKKYESRCREFLERTIPKSKDDSLTNSARRALENPMDLTIVSQMLIRDQKPDLLRLQQQQFDSMAKDYETTQKKPFPMETFSQALFEMRLTDQSDLDVDRFAAETECMRKHRMVVRREIPAMDGESRPTVVWRFRHDKVMEFFIVESFLRNPELQTSHFGDERFRGVYFLLANTLSPEDAKALCEKLILHAAKTKDHNVSDEFVILLNDREQLEQ